MGQEKGADLSQTDPTVSHSGPTVSQTEATVSQTEATVSHSARLVSQTGPTVSHSSAVGTKTRGAKTNADWTDYRGLRWQGSANTHIQHAKGQCTAVDDLIDIVGGVLPWVARDSPSSKPWRRSEEHKWRIGQSCVR